MMQRKPIPKESYDFFWHIVFLHAEYTKITKNPEIKRALDILEDVLNKEAAKTLSKKESDKLNNSRECKKFISIFNKRFFDKFEYEYCGKFSNTTNLKIDNFVTKLEEFDSNVEEFLDWFFTDHIETCGKTITITPSFVVCNSVLDSFIQRNRDKLLNRREEKKENLLQTKLMSDAREEIRKLKENNKEKNLVDALCDLKEGKIGLEYFKEILENIKKNNDFVYNRVIVEKD